MVHRKYCFLTFLFFAVITHSKGLHESLWGQEVPGGPDKEENEKRVRRASGKEELETGTKIEGVLKWGDNYMRKQYL